jgi:hypothetical protein
MFESVHRSFWKVQTTVHPLSPVCFVLLWLYVESLSEDKPQDFIVAFNNTSRYLDVILFNLVNSYFDQIVSNIYPNELQLNETNSWNFSSSFLDLHITVNNNTIHTKIYAKRDDFDFGKVNFPHLDGHAASYWVYVFLLARFARA